MKSIYKILIIVFLVILTIFGVLFINFNYHYNQQKQFNDEVIQFCKDNGYNYTLAKKINNSVTKILCFNNKTDYKMYNGSDFYKKYTK